MKKPSVLKERKIPDVIGKTGVADDATDRVSASLGFATLDIEILRSVPGG
jgi:hypothetical protein